MLFQHKYNYHLLFFLNLKFIFPFIHFHLKFTLNELHFKNLLLIYFTLAIDTIDIQVIEFANRQVSFNKYNELEEVGVYIKVNYVMIKFFNDKIMIVDQIANCYYRNSFKL